MSAAPELAQGEPAELVQRLLARDPADFERVLPVDARQRELTQRHIVPSLPRLEAEFLEIRRGVDARFAALCAGADPTGPRRAWLETYPKGFCRQITLAAVAEFERRSREAPSEATRAVAAFRFEGGHVNKLWGVLRGRYFQNALQLGSLYFDVANDTVDVRKPPLEVLPLAESGFKNIESFEEFAEVAEPYWQCRVFPNRHFPRLAPFFPILRDTASGSLVLESHTYSMQRLNLEADFRASERFLTESAWAGRALPDTWVEAILRFKREALAPEARTPEAGASPERLAALCAEYRKRDAFRSRALLSRLTRGAAAISVGLSPVGER